MCGVIEALTGVMTLMQARQQNQQYKAQEAAYKAQEIAAEQNARITEKKGEQIADKYAVEQQRLDDKRRLVRGQIAAEQGAAGFTGIGSGLDILASSGNAYMQDSMNLLKNQRNDAWSNYADTVNFENQAAGARAARRNIAAQRKAAMFSTILGGAASIYGMQAGRGGSSKAKSDGGTIYNGTDGMPHYSPSNRFGQMGMGDYTDGSFLTGQGSGPPFARKFKPGRKWMP